MLLFSFKLVLVPLLQFQGTKKLKNSKDSYVVWFQMQADFVFTFLSFKILWFFCFVFWGVCRLFVFVFSQTIFFN